MRSLRSVTRCGAETGQLGGTHLRRPFPTTRYGRLAPGRGGRETAPSAG